MVVVGVDVHKRTHTFVAADQAGRQLAELTTRTDPKGLARAIAWASREFAGQDLVWGIEDARHLSTRLEIALLDAGQQVVRVPSKLMAERRRVARSQGKSDPIDALAVARVVLREPDLQPATLPDQSRELRLLTNHRDDQVKHRTALINKLRDHLHLIDPTLDPSPRSLARAKTRRELADFLADRPGIDARLARELLTDIETLTGRIDELEEELAALVADQAPQLLEIPGCAALSAAKIIGQTAGITRFATEAKYARYAGIAPIPVWSGSTNGKVRLSRAGDRQLNAAIHRIALTQIRRPSPGRTYYDQRRAAGDTKAAALRALKRRLIRVVYTTLNQPHERQLPAAA